MSEKQSRQIKLLQRKNYLGNISVWLFCHTICFFHELVLPFLGFCAQNISNFFLLHLSFCSSDLKDNVLSFSLVCCLIIASWTTKKRVICSVFFFTFKFGVSTIFQNRVGGTGMDMRSTAKVIFLFYLYVDEKVSKFPVK